MKLGLTIAMVVLVCGCNELQTELSDLAPRVTAITFTSGIAAIQTNAVITDAVRISSILKSIDIGRKTPYSKHPFANQMLITTSDGEQHRVEFEREMWGQYCSIRTVHRQFILSDKSFRLLMKESEASNNTSEGIRQPADGLPKPSM